MRRLLVPLALAAALAACSNGGSVDADAIRGPELAAVRTALDSAFLHDTTLDRAFTGDSGFYALLAALVFPFIDRASRIAEGVDTTRIVGIEFDIDATQRGTRVVSNLSVELAWMSLRFVAVAPMTTILLVKKWDGSRLPVLVPL